MRRPVAKKGGPVETPPPPTVFDLVDAPEFAAVILLEHALGVVIDALLAEHPTLIDDFAVARSKSIVMAHADSLWRRAAAMHHLLQRYRLAVRDASTPVVRDDSDDDTTF